MVDFINWVNQCNDNDVLCTLQSEKTNEGGGNLLLGGELMTMMAVLI